MKNKPGIIICVIYFICFNVKAGQIKITISNIEEKIGIIHFGVYDNAETFLEEDSRLLGGYETVEKVFNIADGCIIGSALKVDGNTWNPVDPDLAKSFMELVKKLR